ncbi:MAG: OmpA family protein [Spirosomataceae bacterium]
MNSSNFVWILLLVLWIAGSTWWHVCKIKLLCEAGPKGTTEMPTVTIPPLQMVDGADLMVTSEKNFSFAKSGHKANFYNIAGAVNQVVNYLRQNPEKRVVITGYYSPDEINATEWENLGLARAEEVKTLYTSRGIASNVFFTKGRPSDELVFIRDSLWGGIDHQFMEALTLTETRLAEDQKFIDIFKPLDLYFNTGSLTYITTPDNERFLEEARLFLQQNPDHKIILTGHTDREADETGNMELARERTEAVKAILEEFGIAASQIMVENKGDQEPKSSNDTAEGRAANRRVTMVVRNQNAL